MNPSVNLEEPITGLKGVGEKSARLYQHLGIFCVEDLLRYYPRSYESFEAPVPVTEIREDTLVSIRAVIIKPPVLRRFQGRSMLTMEAQDITGSVQLTWFNQPYLKNAVPTGRYMIFRGKVIRKGSRLIMNQPRIFSETEYESISGSLLPNYPLTKGLTVNALRKVMQQAVERLPYLTDMVPQILLDRHPDLMPEAEALRTIHFPESSKRCELARRRLGYDEFLLFLLRIRRMKDLAAGMDNHFVMQPVPECDQLLQRLPYELTPGQQTVWQDIQRDLTGPHCMNRLIQGDVGSGKTILAFLSLLMTAVNGYQGALMAPTEVLASQHYEGLCELIRQYQLPLKPTLLIGSLKASEKKKVQAAIAAGEYNCVIGTHALVQEKVAFRNLALVITDEQHRFGVNQRQTLASKGEEPHILAMSATPIPRTLAIILYGDLQVSLLKDMPGGRKKIKNAVVPAAKRPASYKFIADEVAKGHQAYVICPMIEAGEQDAFENVTDTTEKLREVLPSSVRIAMLHGQMKPQEKDQLMEAYAAHEIDVLVSTTVIEVGINVPNATVMMIENAERFGLAQLHQLRGRVGRGQDQSYCIFVNTSDKEEAGKRLDIMNRSNDGFEIAEEDLKQRGPGEFFGIRQSGEFAFCVGDIYQDADLVKEAAADADLLLSQDPELEQEEHALLRSALLGTGVTL